MLFRVQNWVPQISQKTNECLCYCAENITEYHFSWCFTRDTEFNIKQQATFFIPSQQHFCHWGNDCTAWFTWQFHCAFVPLFFHARWLFPSCSHSTQLSRMEPGQFFSSHNVIEVTRVSFPFKKPNFLLSRFLFLPRYVTVLLSSYRMAKGRFVSLLFVLTRF